tara:strand:+ start:1076 stop:1702 length:627 start_codon:yes stop_codon:yes gene_type:complete
MSKYNGGNNPISVNSGGGLTMKKKARAKHSNISGNGTFSLNGISNNNIFNNVGNPNSAVRYAGCKTYDNTVKTSVKSSHSYINSKLMCHPVNSLKCSKILYSSIADLSLNKHLNSNNRDQSSYIYLLRAKCNIVNDISYQNGCDNLCDDKCKTSNSTSTNRTLHLARCNNITKNINTVQVPSYNMYIGNLFKKKTCLYNPPDVRSISC